MRSLIESKLEQLQQVIDYTFSNKELLLIALTHSSFANESKEKLQNNERQEFLGDAVLSIVVSDFLFRNFRVPEGDLTKLRATLVCEQSLFEYALSMNLGDYLFLGHGERQNGGARRPSILADAFEALIAAIYLDSGIDATHQFIIPFVEDMLRQGEEFSFQDFKTVLQELVQKNPQDKIRYSLVSESGPDHNKEFVVEVQLNEEVLSQGKGRSKKNAEQQAAANALKEFQ